MPADEGQLARTEMPSQAWVQERNYRKCPVKHVGAKSTTTGNAQSSMGTRAQLQVARCTPPPVVCSSRGSARVCAEHLRSYAWRESAQRREEWYSSGGRGCAARCMRRSQLPHARPSSDCNERSAPIAALDRAATDRRAPAAAPAAPVALPVASLEATVATGGREGAGAAWARGDEACASASVAGAVGLRSRVDRGLEERPIRRCVREKDVRSGDLR